METIDFDNDLADGLCLALEQLELVVGEDAVELLLKHWKLVLLENKIQNLVSRKTSEREGLVLHVADSLTALKLNVFKGELSVLDFGSGGGFPGLPLKIARPTLKMTLAEARGKKAEFLSKASRELGFSDVSVYPNNIIEGCKDSVKLGGPFDVVAVRAVDTIDKVARRVVPLIKEGGYLVAYKGAFYKNEMLKTFNSIVKQGLSLEMVITFSLPCEGNPKRSLLLFRKTA
jgi:16S rRNA (guanine527-N7)-methyltransferase